MEDKRNFGLNSHPLLFLNIKVAGKLPLLVKQIYIKMNAKERSVYVIFRDEET